MLMMLPQQDDIIVTSDILFHVGSESAPLLLLIWLVYQRLSTLTD